MRMCFIDMTVEGFSKYKPHIFLQDTFFKCPPEGAKVNTSQQRIAISGPTRPKALRMNISTKL